MNELFSNRFEESLQKIEASLHKKGGIKRYDRVLMRIGRAQESYPSVHRFYRIDIEKDEKEVVTAMQWVKKQECDMDADSGTYFLRTSVERLDEKTTRDYYNLIREIEATFRCLKTDLDLRPIYHQKDESCEAHLFFGLLSYWVVNTIRHQLKQKGIRHHWTEPTRIMSTQKAVTTTAVNKPGERVAFRNCTLPESKVAEIYDALNYQHQPFKRRKICTPQTYPPEYSSCCTAISSA